MNPLMQQTVEKQLNTWLNEEKPEIFAQPLPLENELSKMDQNNPEDYDFGFEIGLKPVFEIPDLAKAKLTLHRVEVTGDMLNEEINRMQIKGGKMTEPDLIDNKENVLNVLFTEVDANGNPIEGGIIKENSVLLKYFTPAMQQELMGRKTGDHFVFQLKKTFEGDKLEIMLEDLGLAKDNKEAGEKYFNLQVVKIGLIEKKEMAETFFEEVFPGKNIKNEDEFREALKDEMEKYWESQSRNQLHDQLYHLMIDNTQMDFPESFLKRWLQSGGDKPKSAEEAEREFPTFSNQLKWTLISDRLVKENKLDVTAEELKENMKLEVMRYFGQMNLGEDMSWLDSYIERMMKDEKQVDATYRRLITEKLFNWIESQTNPIQQTITAEALTALQHTHQH